MKTKWSLQLLILVFGNLCVTAQTSVKDVRRSDRKIIEVRKWVDLTSEQEQKVRNIFDLYNQKVDSALYRVSDPVEAAVLKYNAGKEYEESFLSVLSESQKSSYSSFLKQVSEKKKKEGKTDKKIDEIKQIVKINPSQEREIRNAYEMYCAETESLKEIGNASDRAGKKYEADKKYNQKLMSVLTDNQRSSYIRTNAVPEITEKVKYKISLLEETGEYTREELKQKEGEIFEYLMSEKIAYTCHKYDPKKQKENIRKLKKFEPKALRESNTREKLKAQGQIRKNGKINW